MGLQYKQPLLKIKGHLDLWNLYPTKKETHHYDFPIKISL